MRHNTGDLGHRRHRLPDFFQALHQGTDIVPLDILLPLRATGLTLPGAWGDSHRVLAANALAGEALAVGSPNGMSRTAFRWRRPPA